MAWTLGMAVMKINSFQEVALFTGAAEWAFFTDFEQVELTIEAFAKGVCRAVEAVATGSHFVRKVVRLA
jgi:hypothetical protein